MGTFAARASARPSMFGTPARLDTPFNYAESMLMLACAMQGGGAPVPCHCSPAFTVVPSARKCFQDGQQCKGDQILMRMKMCCALSLAIARGSPRGSPHCGYHMATPELVTRLFLSR
eukprot:scaffold285334_cov21-Tisochrysis_lutea.AAC.1